MSKTSPQKQSEEIIKKIIVFGSTNIKNLPLSQIKKNQIEVGILEQYPPLQNKKQFIDFSMWAYPDGIKIYNDNLRIINDSQPEFSLPTFNTPIERNPKDTMHSFVLTDYQLNRTYCTCLTWHEKAFIQDDELESQASKISQIDTNNRSTQNRKMISENYFNLNPSQLIPKCTLQQLTQNPLYLDQLTAMIYVPKTLIICSSISCFDFQREFLKFYYEKVIYSYDHDLQIEVSQISTFKKLAKIYGYLKGQEKFDDNKTKVLNERHIYIVKKNSKSPVKTYKKEKLDEKNKYRLKRKSLIPLYTSLLKLPIYVEHPQIITENSQQIASLPFIKDNPLSPPNVDIFKIFELLTIDNFLLLWKCILLERQVLVFSSQPYLIIQLFQTLIYLIQPLQWQNIYIPFLPFHLYQNVDTIGGYMIGMSRIHMDYVHKNLTKIIENFNLGNKCLVNLDEMIIVEEKSTAEIPLPDHIRQYLKRKLSFLLPKPKTKSLYDTFSIPSFSNTSNLNETFIPQSQLNGMFMKTAIEIKLIFMNAITILLNNYLSFTNWDEQQGVKIKMQQYLECCKQSEKSKSIQKQKTDEENNWVTFMKAMSKTMVFIRLLQYHLKNMKTLNWKQQNFRDFYLYCYNILQSQQEKKKQQEANDGSEFYFKLQDLDCRAFRQYQQYVLSSSIKAFNQIIQYKVEHYAIKYLKQIELNKMEMLIDKQQKGWQRSLWEIFTFQKQVKAGNQKDRKQRLNQRFSFTIKRILNLRHIFQFLKADLIEPQKSINNQFNSLQAFHKQQQNH